MAGRTWEQEEVELQDPATWVGKGGFEQPGNPARQAIVSVPFEPEDFAAVVQAARDAGFSTSEFIRAAALKKARSAIDKRAGGRAV